MKTLRASKKRFSESPLREGESNSRDRTRARNIVGWLLMKL